MGVPVRAAPVQVQRVATVHWCGRMWRRRQRHFAASCGSAQAQPRPLSCQHVPPACGPHIGTSRRGWKYHNETEKHLHLTPQPNLYHYSPPLVLVVHLVPPAGFGKRGAPFKRGRPPCVPCFMLACLLGRSTPSQRPSRLGVTRDPLSGCIWSVFLDLDRVACTDLTEHITAVLCQDCLTYPQHPLNVCWLSVALGFLGQSHRWQSG